MGAMQHDLANHTYEDEWALLKERYLSEATEEKIGAGVLFIVGIR